MAYPLTTCNSGDEEVPERSKCGRAASGTVYRGIYRLRLQKPSNPSSASKNDDGSGTIARIWVR